MTRHPQASAQPRRVFIVDDHPVVREGLNQLLRRDGDLAVVGESSTCTGVLNQLHSTNPDLVLADLTLVDGDGLDLLKDIRARLPHLPVLILSMHDEDLYAERVIRAGGCGYLMKSVSPERLLDAIRRAMAGEIILSPAMAQRILHQAAGKRSASSPRTEDSLTDRELQIMELCGKGYGPLDIATRLHLSHKTVETHLDRIKHKLSLGDTGELRRHAINWVHSHGLT